MRLNSAADTEWIIVSKQSHIVVVYGCWEFEMLINSANLMLKIEAISYKKLWCKDS